MKPLIKAFSNNDDAFIVWKISKKIPNCFGFAVYRKLKGETEMLAEPIQSYVGFEDQSPKEGEHRPTTEWPIQKFVWADFSVKTGDVVSYKVVPMIWKDNKLKKDDKNASDWSNDIEIKTGTTFKAYFNRGLVSSQFLANTLQNIPEKDRGKKLNEVLKDEQSKTRAFLGGTLAHTIYTLLDEIIHDENLVLYAALYELNEPKLINCLAQIKKRANVILANGAFKPDDNDPNKEVRASLKNVINLFDRLVTGSHFAHNKFLVVCKKEANGTIIPFKVLTGSTNWTTNGFFTQINNSIVIEDIEVANHYLREWNEIKKAENEYPKSFKDFNTTPNVLNTIQVKTWFTPVTNYVDMEEVRTLIKNANQGILFLMFNPGQKKTLFNAILDKNASNPDFFVHGVINQDPGAKNDPLIFVNRGKNEPTNFNTIIPKSIKIGNRFSKKEIEGKMVKIHSKVILIDPFSDHPIVITGSHNLGEKASRENDDNLNIIKGNKKLAEEYAVHIMSVYNHYRYRFFQSLNEKQPEKGWNGLKYNDSWQDSYLSGSKKNEIDFWLGKL